jgi:hypothetical protein
MSRSYSKIRHILEANQKLERRMLLDKGLLTENRSSYNSQNYLFEADWTLNTMADIMQLQRTIISIEKEKNIVGYVDDGSCVQALKYSGTMGRNVCKVSGSTLCSDPSGICDQNTLIDGVYGPKTKAAYETYKNDLPEQGTEDQRKTDFDIVATGQNIPVTMDQIKAFQLFIWKSEPEDNCSDEDDKTWISMLCGGQCCTVKKAVDGVWGGNTKTAWNKYKEDYLRRYSVNTPYENVFNDSESEDVNIKNDFKLSS